MSENFRILSEELASKSKDISSTITNLEAISDSLASAKLTETVNNMESITARFDRLMAELETGEGAASKLIYDEEVYANMKKATENLNRLLLDIKYSRAVCRRKLDKVRTQRRWRKLATLPRAYRPP